MRGATSVSPAFLAIGRAALLVGVPKKPNRAKTSGSAANKRLFLRVFSGSYPSSIRQILTGRPAMPPRLFKSRKTVSIPRAKRSPICPEGPFRGSDCASNQGRGSSSSSESRFSLETFWAASLGATVLVGWRSSRSCCWVRLTPLQMAINAPPRLSPMRMARRVFAVLPLDGMSVQEMVEMMSSTLHSSKGCGISHAHWTHKRHVSHSVSGACVRGLDH